MTDTKKCGTFLVKIDRLVDGKCIVLSERPSDALILELLYLLDETTECKNGYPIFRMVCKDSSFVAAILQCSDGSWLLDGVVVFPRRFTRLSPFRLLKRRVMESVRFTSSVSAGRVESLVSRLEGVGHEWC